MSEITAEARRRLVETLPLFECFSAAERTRLADRLIERRVAAGTAIFRRGEPGSAMAVVMTGQVRIGVTSAGGREILLQILGPGDVFGELALLDGGSRSADAVAVGACALVFLERRDLLPILREHPETALRLIHLVCGRLRIATARLEETALLTVEARLARLLLLLADREGRLPPTGDARRGGGLSQTDLGRLAGASRQRINLQLGRWIADGLLRRDDGGLRITRPDLLGQLAEQPEEEIAVRGAGIAVWRPEVPAISGRPRPALAGDSSAAWPMGL